MKILVVDNEEIALDGLCRTIKNALPDADMQSTSDPRKAFEMAKKYVPDIAFLDIEMPEINGMDLAMKIKDEVSAKTNIIFVTGYNEYVEEAFINLRVSGYLMKPVTEDMILTEIDNLRYPVELKGNKRVRIRAFGTFEIYIDDEPVTFHYTKTKELCAYLVDREGMCSHGEIQEAIWEDEEELTDHSSYLRNMISDLYREFKKRGCGDVIIKKYGSVGLDKSKVDCDYYEYKSGNPAAVNAFQGEYMSQYSWAEFTLGGLMREE